jgi:hypothetical protein
VSGRPLNPTEKGRSHVTVSPLLIAHTHLQGKYVGEELVRHLYTENSEHINSRNDSMPLP